MANGNSENSKKVNLKRYETDVEGLSLKTLETGLWLTKNRPKFKTALIVLLALISTASWSFTLYGFGYYLLIGMNEDARQIKELVQTATVDKSYLLSRAAKELVLSSVGAIDNNGKLDLYISVRNPNARYWAIFNYCFKGGEEKICGADFILPGEQKYILALAQDFKARPASLTFSITALDWRKINNHQIPDWKEYRDTRLDIAITNSSFVSDSGEISGKMILNTLNFNAANKSPYSYWEAPFIIILSSGGKISGVNRYIIKDFYSYGSQNIKIIWPGAMGAANDISITPDINILDKRIYQ